MSELKDTEKLANAVLDRVNADPDDDCAMLARQFLRARECEAALRDALEKVYNIVKEHPDFQNRDKYLTIGMSTVDILNKSGTRV